MLGRLRERGLIKRGNGRRLEEQLANKPILDLPRLG